MSDPRLTDLLVERSERGTPRGAEQVWADAAEPNYVTEPPPPARPGLWLAAAATCVFLLAGLFVVRQGGDEISVADRFDDGSEWAAHCFLEVDRGWDRSLAEWAEALEAEPGFEQVDTVDLPEGGAYLGVMPHVIESPYGIAFEAHPMSTAEALANEPGVTELTCVEIPVWSRIPDPIPDDTTVLAVFVEPEDPQFLYELAPDLMDLPWQAYENISSDRSGELFSELFAGQPDVLDSLHAELEARGPNPMLLLVADEDVGWIVEEFSARDDVAAVVPVPRDQ